MKVTDSSKQLDLNANIMQSSPMINWVTSKDDCSKVQSAQLKINVKYKC